MKNYVMHKDVTAHYTSLEDLRAGWNLPPVQRKTSNADKLKSQQEKFLSKHICKACGKPMVYSGGNLMICTNPDCKGIKVEKTLKKFDHGVEKEEVRVNYLPSFDILTDRGADIAHNIFE